MMSRRSTLERLAARHASVLIEMDPERPTEEQATTRESGSLDVQVSSASPRQEFPVLSYQWDSQRNVVQANWAPTPVQARNINPTFRAGREICRSLPEGCHWHNEENFPRNRKSLRQFFRYLEKTENKKNMKPVVPVFEDNPNAND